MFLEFPKINDLRVRNLEIFGHYILPNKFLQKIPIVFCKNAKIELYMEPIITSDCTKPIIGISQLPSLSDTSIVHPDATVATCSSCEARVFGIFSVHRHHIGSRHLRIFTALVGDPTRVVHVLGMAFLVPDSHDTRSQSGASRRVIVGQRILVAVLALFSPFAPLSTQDNLSLHLWEDVGVVLHVE